MAAYNIRLEQVSFFNLSLTFWVSLFVLIITGGMAFIIPVMVVKLSLGAGAALAFFNLIESVAYNHRLYETNFKGDKHHDNQYPCSWRGKDAE